MKNIWIAFGIAALAAIVLEYFGLWWAMPIAGLIAGWMIANGGRGFLFGGLGVALTWIIYIVFFAGKLRGAKSGVNFERKR